MDIESLNKAVEAAGYAMAAHDDEMEAADTAMAPKSRALALIEANPTPRPAVEREALNRIATWFRGYAPGFGGRAPA